MRFTGLVSRRTYRLRVVVSHDRAVLAVDLADDKQVVVVCDHVVGSRGPGGRPGAARSGGRRRHLGIPQALYAAACDDRGVAVQRAGALERSALVLADSHQALAALAEVGLAELELVTSIRGVSVVGAAAILAETGDPPASTTAERSSSTLPCARRTTPGAPLPARRPSRVEVGRPAA